MDDRVGLSLMQERREAWTCVLRHPQALPFGDGPETIPAEDRIETRSIAPVSQQRYRFIRAGGRGQAASGSVSSDVARVKRTCGER